MDSALNDKHAISKMFPNSPESKVQTSNKNSSELSSSEFLNTTNVKFESKLINKFPTHESVEEGEIQSFQDLD